MLRADVRWHIAQYGTATGFTMSTVTQLLSATTWLDSVYQTCIADYSRRQWLYSIFVPESTLT